MLQRCRVWIVRQRTPLLFACLPLLLVVAAKSRSLAPEPGQITRLALLFVAGYLACLLFRQLTAAALAGEDVDALGAELGFDPRFLLVLRELVRTAVGVCLMLAWIAGLLFLQERLLQLGLPVMLAAWLLLTLASILAARLWLALINCLRLPQEDG